MSIKLDLKIFLFFLLFLITSQAEIYVLLMIFACIHELAHLFTGLILGFKPQELRITPVGLQVSFKIKCEEYNKKILKGNSLGIKKAIIALAGPMINFIILFCIIILSKVNVINLENIIYQDIIYANALIGLFNLIPIYPLDGGRIVNEILHLFIGLKKSYNWTHYISKYTIIILTIIASIAILYIHNISILFIITYLWILVLKEKRVYETRKEIARLDNLIECNRVVHTDITKRLAK